MARPRNIVPNIKLKREGSRWVCQWFANGKLVRRGCEGAVTEEEARQVAGERFEQWKHPAPPTNWTVNQLLDAYILYKTQGPHPRERAQSPSFTHNLAPIRSYFGAYRLAQLGPDAWESYRTFRTGMDVRNAGAKVATSKGQKARKVSDATAVRELNALRGALNWAKSRNWSGLAAFDTKTAMRLRNVQAKPRGQYLTRSEFSRLIDAVKGTPHLELFCRIAVATGARMSAILELTWDDVTWPHNPFKGGTPMDDGEFSEDAAKWLLSADEETVRAELSSYFEIDMGPAVGNKKRPSGLISQSNTGLYHALVNAWMAHDDRKRKGLRTCNYIVSFQGRPIKSVDLSDEFERAKVPNQKRTQHVLKHTCCSWLVQAGYSYIEVADVVGTSAATIERFYGHLDRSRANRLGKVLNV